MAVTFYDRCSSDELKKFCENKGLVSTPSVDSTPMDLAPVTGQARKEYMRLLKEAEEAPQFVLFDQLPVELRNYTFELFVLSQSAKSTRDLLCVDKQTAEEVKSVQFKFLPFLIKVRAVDDFHSARVDTKITIGHKDITSIRGNDLHHGNAAVETHQSPLSFQKRFPLALKACRQIKLDLSIECDSVSTSAARMKQTSHLLLTLVSHLRNDQSTKCRSMVIGLDFTRFKEVLPQIILRQTLPAAVLRDVLWPLQYVPPDVSLTIIGTLPVHFLVTDFDESRNVWKDRQDSIIAFDKLLPRYDLAMELIPQQTNGDLAARLETAMRAVRRFGPTSNHTNVNDVAAITALRRLEKEMENLHMEDLISARDKMLDAKKALEKLGSRQSD